nr:MFS transporter [Legionella lansingensis]
MQEEQLSALQAGILGSAFYYIYTSMQIPVGILFDRRNTRLLLAANALLCSIGCFFFAHSHHLFLLIIGRMLIGAGSAFAFIGLSHLLRQHFPLKQFAFIIGLSETLGFLATMFGMIGMGAFIAQWGWRSIINSAGIVGLCIAFLSWQYIPGTTREITGLKYTQQLTQIFKNSSAWVNGLFVGLSFTVITVFGAMWAVPFIQIKLSCSLKLASTVDSMIFLGAAISCPLFGYLASLFSYRFLMIVSCFSTAGLILVILYLPFNNIFMLAFFMFLIGVCCGAYMLAYSIANELAPIDSLSTCTGFTNTLAMLTAPILQPLLGLLLDKLQEMAPESTLFAYQIALSIVPLSLIIAASLVVLLPLKR